MRRHLLDHHARTADRPRRRCARGRGETNEGLGHVLGPDARPGRLADDGAGHGSSAPTAPGSLARWSRPASTRASAWRRSFQASPTGPSSSPRSSKPCAQPGRRASGRTCSTCARERRSTSSRRLPGTGPRSSSGTSSCTHAARISPTPRRSRCAPVSAISLASTGFATAGSVKLAPPPEPVQLSLHV